MIYITTGSTEEARSIGDTIVKERLAACANIIDGMNSIYTWDGSLQNDRECVLIMKTRQELIEALTDRVKELHSYSVPCIIALPIVGGNQDYIQWIYNETRNL